MDWSLSVSIQFGDFNGTPIAHQLLEDYLLAPDDSPGDGTVPGTVPPPNLLKLKMQMRISPPSVDAADVERVKRRLNF